MMKRNMTKWMQDKITASVKEAMPILSFPGIQLIGHTVEELVQDGHLQAMCMDAAAKHFQTAEAFGLMDLSVEAEAFGSPVKYSENEVPTVTAALVHDMREAEMLKVPEVGAKRTGQYIRAIKEASDLITDRPVLAGMIGPYSLAGRLLDMTEIMILCYEEPELVEKVLTKATEFLISYARAFKAAGADGIVIAEPAAGLLSPAMIGEFSTPYVRKIRDAVREDSFIVLYHNCGNVIPLLDNIREIEADGYSFGNAVDMEEVLRNMPKDSLIIGNIDPAGVLRNGTPELVREEVTALLQRCHGYPNFVISSGCDIPPGTPMQNMQALMEAAEEFYRKIEC